MAETSPEPQSKAELDENLNKVLNHFASLKQNSFEKRTNNQQVEWVRPPKESGWNGDLQTEQGLIDLHKAFNTDKAEEKLIEACNPDEPGTSSDGIALTLQIEYMMQAERAYRARVYQPFHRSLAHLATREKGHGQDTGPFLGQVIEYINLLIKRGA